MCRPESEKKDQDQNILFLAALFVVLTFTTFFVVSLIL